MRSLVKLGVALVALATLVVAAAGSQGDGASPAASRTRPALYWGAYAAGGQYGLTDAPFEIQSLARFEANAGKRVSLVEWGQTWVECSSDCGLRPFRAELMQKVRDRGAIPVLSWGSGREGTTTSDPKFTLRAIIAGRYDRFIADWARGARRWGHPFFLRFDWEMNTIGVPYGERSNGNRPGEFVRMWRRVHRIFTRVGARNATWVWCPNVEYRGSVQPLRSLYPGDKYVDWTCLDGYNWGTNPSSPRGWQSFDRTFRSTYDLITSDIAPSKPMMIGETAASEFGGSKAAWVTDALGRLPRRYPKARALVWFNKNADGMDWIIESSPAAQRAFATGIARPAYVTNRFGEIATSPIPPP